MSVWLREDFAEAQLEGVCKELAGIWPETYMAFGSALNAIPLKCGTILDAGCGVGGYAHIIKKLRPKLTYTGTDISKHMIATAKRLAPQAAFEEREFYANDFDAFDIVLTASTIDYTDDPWDALSFLLENAKGYVVIHRLHLTDDKSQKIPEITYCAETALKMKWNRSEILAFIADRRELIDEILWSDGQMLTVALESTDGQN